MKKTGTNDCENDAAEYFLKSASSLEQHFKDVKLHDFEAKIGALASQFGSLRAAAAGARDYDSAVSATMPTEKALDSFEAAFEKWYDAEADDPSFFAHIASRLLDLRLRLELYRGATGAYGKAAGDATKAKAACEELNGEFKSAVQKFDSLAQQEAGKTRTDAEKQRAERITDLTSTMLRYLDLNHEATMLGVDGHVAGKEGVLQEALRLTGSVQGQVSDMRAHAYHLNNDAMQQAAAEASFSFYAYIGALCAAFAAKEM